MGWESYLKCSLVVVIEKVNDAILLRYIQRMIFVIIHRNAGYPDDPAMHGLIAGLWSSLSGAGRFVSRVGSGVLVDNIGFDSTAVIVTVLQAGVVSFFGWP
jgi:hypothetical protein